MGNKKTQTIVVIILIITAILGIAGAAFVYYLSTKDQVDPTTQREREQYCACITAYTTPECNDCSCTQIEAQTLEAKLGEIVDGVCSLDCESTVIVEEEEEEEITSTNNLIQCLIPSVPSNSCHSVSVNDLSTRELLVPPIIATQDVIISAKFLPEKYNNEVEEFNKFVFIVNGIRTELDAEDVPSKLEDGERTYLPEIEFSNFENVDTLTIQASATSDKNPDGGSLGKYCYKQYNLEQGRPPLCSALEVYTRDGATENITLINQLKVRIPNLVDGSQISIEFSFDDDAIPNIRTNNIPDELLEEMLVNDILVFEYEHLYPTDEYADLYAQGSGFPTFDSNIMNTDVIRTSAQVYVNNNAVDSTLCTSNIYLSDVTQPEEEEERDEEEERPDSELTEQADIFVSMEGPNCVAKAANVNSTKIATYKVNVKNNSSTSENITNITTKLPQGFKYIENSSKIDRATISDSLLTVTPVGQSEELKWANTWTIPANSTLTLEYSVNVSHLALDGVNQSESVVTPVNIPEDTSTLRAEFVTTISATCEDTPPDTTLPETGNWTIITFIVGMFVVLFGTLVYKGKIGILDRMMLNIIGSKAVKKRFMPIEYFEESIIEKEEKEKD
jgi:hypothetical protein